MKNIMFTGLLLSVVIFFSCKEEVTNPPENPLPEGFQQDVPWPSLADSPWPMDHHDPQNTGRSQYSGPVFGALDLVIDSVNIYNSISIGKDSTIYMAIGNGLKTAGLYTMKPNGEVKWIYKFLSPSVSYATPLIASDGTIYCSSLGADSKLFAINPDGTLKWALGNVNLKMNGITIGLDGTIYFIQGGGNGTLTAVSKDGAILWTYSDPKIYGGDVTGISFSPDGKTLYLFTYIENKSLAAFDISSRTIKWGFGFDASGHPMVDCKGNLYLVANDSSLNEGSAAVVSLSPDGQIRWSYPLPSYSRAFFYTTPTMDKNGNIYCGFDTLYSFDYSGKLRWKKDLCAECENGSGGNVLAPLICDNEGRVYVTISWDGASNMKELAAYTSEGTKLWGVTAGYYPSNARYSAAIGLSKDFYLPTIYNAKLLKIK